MRSDELLQAVADGQVQRVGTGVQGRTYQLAGEEITYRELHSLYKRAWIELPLSGPPRITADGAKWLQERA